MTAAIECFFARPKKKLRTVTLLLFLFLISSFCLPARSSACPDISVSEAGQRMSILENDIRYHNQLYYEKAQPIISDAEYDRQFAELVQLEECFPALTAADSPTGRVGGAVNGGAKKVPHERPMLSLSSSTGSEAVEALLKRFAAIGEVQLLVQPKVDGLPVELIYESGRLVSASTRGDGRFGEDVIERVRQIQGIPQLLFGTIPDRVVARGEVYADLPLMQKFTTETAPEKYASPRHFAAGLLKAHKPDPSALAALRLFPFELVSGGLADGNPHSDRCALQLLSDWGFPVVVEQTTPVRSFAEVQAVYHTYLSSREQQPFAMDGIVVKVDDLSLRQQLGEGGRAPFWAAAWKFPPQSARTRVLDILWTVGRTGRRTPIAEVVPVDLGGVRVSRVSLNNEAEVARLNIAAGDQVVIALVGDVIPQVQEVVERAARNPDSGAATVPMPGPTPDACLHDTPVCRNQFLARAAYFTSKSGFHIAGLGRKRLQKLVEAGLVDDLPSLFLLKAEQVATVPGFAKGSAHRLTAAIRAAAHPDAFRVVAALGIPGVGLKTAQHLAHQFASLDALLAAGQEQLTALSATDLRAARTIRTFFNLPGAAELLMKFRKQGIL